MKIKIFIGGFDKNLSYLIWYENSKKTALIDPSTEPTKIINFIQSNKLILEKILITHTHNDHIKYLDHITKKYPFTTICGHTNPQKHLNPNYRGLNHHEIISLGLEIVTIIHTPGHYPDSVCYWNKKYSIIFTGDTMFVGRTGRTIGEKSNISQLYNSIYNELLILPHNTIIYPGHHYGYKKNISIKENIYISSFFQCKSESEFKLVMKNYEDNR